MQAELIRARSERKRQEGLYQTHSTTEQNLEAAVAAEGSLSAQFASRDADLNQAQTMLRSSELAAEVERRSKVVLESQGTQLQADLHAKQASLAAVQVNLGYTKIYAPGDGTVGERQVRPGQLVSPGTQVISFVALTKWVQANYRETQLTNVKVGDAAELRIDEYPGQLIRGKVVEIAPASGSQFALLPPDNATGNFTKVVQRIPVKIALDDPAVAARLRPGLSVVATVRTRQITGNIWQLRPSQFARLRSRSRVRPPRRSRLKYRRVLFSASWEWSLALDSSLLPAACSVSASPI